MYRIFNMFQRKHLISACLILALFFFWKCSDFLEDDLEDVEVILLTPPDNHVSTLSTQTFWWDPVKDASGYNLQIVAPSFDNMQRLLLDTNIVDNQFQFTLAPGEYQWGVIAYNSSSSTYQYYFTLVIDTSGILTGEQIILLSPSNDLNTNHTNILFKWDKNPKADNFYFEIKKESGELLTSQITENDTFRLNIAEGKYIWGVQALNDVSSSLLTTRTLIVDTTKPLMPLLLQPKDQDTITQTPFSLSWNRQGTSTSLVSDSVLIATDTLFSTLVDLVITEETSCEITDEDNGVYYWKVKSFDKAGNASDYCHFRKYTIIK